MEKYNISNYIQANRTNEETLDFSVQTNEDQTMNTSNNLVLKDETVQTSMTKNIKMYQNCSHNRNHTIIYKRDDMNKNFSKHFNSVINYSSLKAAQKEKSNKYESKINSDIL